MPVDGVPLRLAVPLPLSVKVTPPGRAPLSLSAGVGKPLVVTVKLPAVPTVKVVVLALVIVGATGPDVPRTSTPVMFHTWLVGAVSLIVTAVPDAAVGLVCDWVQNVPNYGRELGRSNYLGVGGPFGNVDPNDAFHAQWYPFKGIYYANSRTRVTDISDGTSNTLAFGEYLGGLSLKGTRPLEQAWMGAGWLPTKYGLAPVYGPQGNDYNIWMFQSGHTGVVNFAFADGSVRGISQTADFNAFIAASGMADGTVFDPSEL